MENDNMTIAQFMEGVWETYKDHPQITHPGWWKMNSVKTTEELKEETDEDNILLNNFAEAIGKVTKGWWTNYKKWAVTQYSELFDKSSRLVGVTYRKSFPIEMMENVTSYWHTYISLGDHTEEEFSAILTTKTTSISSMIAHGPIEVAVATGVKRSALDAFKELQEKIVSSPSSATTTGTMSSYISSSTSGEYPWPKYGLTEKYKDYRLQVT